MSLKDKIREKMNELNLSVAGLERKAGLRTSAVRNILEDRSRHPNAQTLKALASVFECEINDLLDAEDASEDNENIYKKKQKPSLKFEDPRLFFQIGEKAVELLQAKQRDITLDQLLKIIKESYAYSIKQEPKEVNIRFIEWTIDKIVR